MLTKNKRTKMARPEFDYHRLFEFIQRSLETIFQMDPNRPEDQLNIYIHVIHIGVLLIMWIVLSRRPREDQDQEQD